jgi:hypothetical protein
MRWLLGALVVLCCCASPASAARIPTPEESAALTALMQSVFTCDTTRSVSVPLVTGDGTWGRIRAGCGNAAQGGAAYRGFGVWAHRSSATATDWRIVGSIEASRVPPCTGKGGLLSDVPEAVVRELREACYDPASARGYRPAPYLSLQIYPVGMDALVVLSDDSGAGGSFFVGSKPTVKRLTREFGRPARTRCGARWARLGLTATACASGRVTKLTVTGPWRLYFEGSDIPNAPVQPGDPIALAAYLDPRLAGLPADGPLRLATMSIGTAEVTASITTRAGSIRAFALDIRRRRD